MLNCVEDKMRRKSQSADPEVTEEHTIRHCMSSPWSSSWCSALPVSAPHYLDRLTKLMNNSMLSSHRSPAISGSTDTSLFSIHLSPFRNRCLDRNRIRPSSTYSFRLFDGPMSSGVLERGIPRYGGTDCNDCGTCGCGD